MPSPLFELLKNLIDYAGLFPPARLPLDRVLRNYAEYQSSDEHWMLGTLILRPEDLSRFFPLGHNLLPREGRGWRIACVLPDCDENQLRSYVSDIDGFNATYAKAPMTRASIDTVELRVRSEAEVRLAAKCLPVHLRVFLEVAFDQAAQLIPMITEAKQSNLHAKFRTGGTNSDSIPADEDVVDAISNCAACRVSFKATAGLHHPIRAEHPLTYEQNSECSFMHGFLNVLAATAIMLADPHNKNEARKALQDDDATSFRVEDGGWFWRQRKFSMQNITRLRTQGMVSFGSCSFVEPVEDLQNLHYNLVVPQEP